MSHPTPPKVEPEASAACWSSKGVYGEGTCSELERFIHCRNCPVYSATALQLLNRPPPAGYEQECGEFCAEDKQAREPSRISAVIFRIGAEWLGLPASVFQEVAEWRPIRSLPHRRQGNVLGLANVRGEVLICVSLGHFLGLEKLPSRETLRRHYGRLMVVHGGGNRLAFPVDEVQGPQRLPPEQLLPPPATVARTLPSYTRSLFRASQRTIGLLNADLLLEALHRGLK